MRSDSGCLIAVEDFKGRTAEEGTRCPIPEVLSPAGLEVRDGRLGHDCTWLHSRGRSNRATWQPASRPRPQGEVPARGMTYESHSSKVKPRRRSHNGEVVNAGRYIGERSGPSAPGLPQPPVLKVPCRHSSADEVESECLHQLAVEAHAPEPTVYENNHRERARKRRKVQVGTL